MAKTPTAGAPGAADGKTDDGKTAGSGALVAASSPGLPAELAEELAQDAGAGTSQSADDNIVPFIVLLQDMSPEVKKRDPAYVEGAEPGFQLNRATKQLYAPDPETAERTGHPMLVFQPCAFDRCVVEWVPRNDGGGFVARHELRGTVEQTMQALGARQVQDPQDPNKKIWRSADGKNDLIDTRYHFGHELRADGSWAPAVVAFSSTGHTASRDWMTQMNNFKIKVGDRPVVAPSWSKKYRLGAKPKSNKKGDFFVISVTDEGVIHDRVLREEGKKLNASVSSGAVRAADETATGDASGDVPI